MKSGAEVQVHIHGARGGQDQRRLGRQQGHLAQAAGAGAARRRRGRVGRILVADVGVERGLSGNRFRGLAPVNRRAIAALRVSLQHGAADSERLHEPLRLVGGELADGAHAHRV